MPVIKPRQEGMLNQHVNLTRHYDGSVWLPASAKDVFSFVDDHARLSSHMSESSWLMGGGSMDISVDEGRGQKVGSHIRLSGKVFRIALFLDEVVTQHEPPRAKTWETVGDLRLLVIGHYRMAVEVVPRDGGSLLCVSIDYALPSTNAWLGRLFGGFYARWCVEQMTKAAQAYFSKVSGKVR